MIPINKAELKKICEEYTKRTGISSAELSRRMYSSKNIVSNAMYSGRIADIYVDKLCEVLGFAGFDWTNIFVLPAEETAPEAPEKPQEAQEEKSRPDDQDLRKELQRLRDDVADLGIMINALRQDRERDTEKLLQILATIAGRQLSQKAIGEEIVTGIIVALGQANIDEPIRSAYETIRNDLQRDIYRAIKGGTK